MERYACASVAGRRGLHGLGRVGAVLVVAAGVWWPVLVGAQGTPAATPEGADVVVVASGLVNPRGFTVAEDGGMLVALGGRGELTAQVVSVAPGDCPAVVVDGFPTSRVAFRAISGFADVAILGGETYALLSGGDIDRDLPVNGVYRLDVDGGTELVADISSFIRDNPIAEVPGDYDTDGQPYDLLAIEDGSGFWVSEGNSNQLMRVGLDGTVARVADLSAGHPIPTGLAPAPDGDIYVALFTSAPYPEGRAKVLRVTPDGEVSDAWTGLTMPSALAVGPDGALYATEMATGYGDDMDAIAPGTGRLVRQTGPASLEVVATGLALPASLTIGPDGAFFLASPTVGADDGSGTIVRIAPGSSLPIDASTPRSTRQFCAPTAS